MRSPRTYYVQMGQGHAADKHSQSHIEAVRARFAWEAMERADMRCPGQDVWYVIGTEDEVQLSSTG